MVDVTKGANAIPSGPSVAEAAAQNKQNKASKPVKKAVKVMGEFSKGGKVKKTGIYKLHANERVLNPSQTKKAEKSPAMKDVLSGELYS